MRDFTGLDSLLSPLFCLLVLVTVWTIERCLPGRDILFFIPKSWRETQPLYQLTDDQAFRDTQADMPKDPAVAPELFEDGASFDEGIRNKARAAAAGRRPELADDSAHAGRNMYNSHPPL